MTAADPRARAPSGRARRLAPEARRAQLLEVALAVFARRGLGGARHAEVAEQAGVAVSTVFVYFPTREALVAAVLDEVERVYTELAREVHASEEPAAQVLLAHASAFAGRVEAQPDPARVWLNWSSAVREELWPRYRAFEDRVLGIIAATLERGQREGTLSTAIAPLDGARIAVGAGHMIAQMKLSGRPEADVERFQAAMVRALAGGLGPGGDAA